MLGCVDNLQFKLPQRTHGSRSNHYLLLYLELIYDYNRETNIFTWMEELIVDVDFVMSIGYWSGCWYTARILASFFTQNNSLTSKNFIMPLSWEKISDTNPSGTNTPCSFTGQLRKRTRNTARDITGLFSYRSFISRFLNSIHINKNLKLFRNHIKRLNSIFLQPTHFVLPLITTEY
jgi:hypothetical protein